MRGGRGDFQAKAEAGGDRQAKDKQFEGSCGEGGAEMFQLPGQDEICQIGEPDLHELPKDKDSEHHEIRQLKGGDLPKGVASDISGPASCFNCQYGGQPRHVRLLFS